MPRGDGCEQHDLVATWVEFLDVVFSAVITIVLVLTFGLFYSCLASGEVVGNGQRELKIINTRIIFHL
jgi:hypothetical protein